MASFERCFLQFSVLKWKFRSRCAWNNHFKPHRAVLPVSRRAEYTGFFSRPAHANAYGQASYQHFHSLPPYFKAVSVWLLLLYLGRAKKTGLPLWCRGKSLHSKQYWAWAISGGARERGWTGGGSFAAPSPTFLLKKLKSGGLPPPKKIRAHCLTQTSESRELPSEFILYTKGFFNPPVSTSLCRKTLSRWRWHEKDSGRVPQGFYSDTQ